MSRKIRIIQKNTFFISKWPQRLSENKRRYTHYVSSSIRVLEKSLMKCFLFAHKLLIIFTSGALIRKYVQQCNLPFLSWHYACNLASNEKPEEPSVPTQFFHPWMLCWTVSIDTIKTVVNQQLWFTVSVSNKRIRPITIL